MKIYLPLLFFCAIVISVQGHLFRIKPDHYSKYSLKVTTFQFNKNSELTGDLLFKFHDDHYDLRWENEKMTDETGNQEKFLTRIRGIEQPVRVEFDRLQLLKIKHQEANSLWTFIFPFNLEPFKDRIEKGEGFTKEMPDHCEFPYTRSDATTPDLYELEMQANGTSCGGDSTTRPPPKFEVNSMQVIRKEDFSLHYFKFLIKLKDNDTVNVFMEFKDFVKAE